MSQLFEAMQNDTVTTNGMPAYKSSLSKVLDLFFKIGTSRGADISAVFKDALNEDAELACKVLLYGRDIRGGNGERQRFRDLLLALVNDFSIPHDLKIKVLDKVPEVGRYDDLHCLTGTAYEHPALTVHLNAIKEGHGLACKWAPRKGPISVKLREMWDVTPKFYRKHIVSHTQVVETQMCKGQWGEISYKGVPSVASKVYAKAFKRQDGERYGAYLESVMNGETTMNAGAIFPHDIYNSSNQGSPQADAQWKSLPNYLEGVDERIMVVSDVSRSMEGMPMAVSVSLGMYFAERLEGVFKDCLITFSEKPSIFKMKSLTLHQRILEVSSMNWGMSTNLESVFDLVLDKAVEYGLPAEQLPTKVLIISDMQFNSAISDSPDRALNMIRKKYEKAGYEMPQLVFWNVNSSDSGNIPVKFNDSGVALLSGSSPAVIKACLGADLDPVKVMMKALSDPRYSL